MALDTAAIGTEQPGVDVDVERGRLRFFAQSIGETDPVYRDVDAARAAGHRDVPVPPTFLMGLANGTPDDLAYLGDLGVDLRYVLHGEQSFTYHAMAYAGDHLHYRYWISDIYSKKGGALDFVEQSVEITRDGEAVAEMRTTLIVTQPGGAA